MPKAVEDYYQRYLKKNALIEEKLKRKEEILAKAREYYGYDVDIRDAKYIFDKKKQT
jgi:hypothetical protein